MYKVYYSINDTLCSAKKFYTKLLEFCVVGRKGNIDFQIGMNTFIEHCLILDDKQETFVKPHSMTSYLKYTDNPFYYTFKKIIIKVNEKRK